MPLVYLAGAIDRAKENPEIWVEAITEALFRTWETRGPTEPLMIYSPFKAFHQGSMGLLDKEHALHSFRINMAAVDEADLLLVHYQPGVETWGTPMEVMQARAHRCPVLVWFMPKVSTDRLPSYLLAFADATRRGYTATAKGAVDLLSQRSIDVKKEE